MPNRSAPKTASSETPAAADEFSLRLYVTGPTPVSSRAVVNTRRFCEQHFKGHYRLEVVNIGDHVERAAHDQVVAAPTLIKVSPLPVRRFIGDMSNTERLLEGLSADALGWAK